MSQWVTKTNIEDFRHKISQEKDADKRRILEVLLAKEVEKQRHEDSQS